MTRFFGCKMSSNTSQTICPVSTPSASVAKQRWLLLGKALVRNKVKDNCKTSATGVSVRRFSTYQLLSTKHLPAEDSKEHSWFEYTSPSDPDFNLQIRHFKKKFSPAELMGFNNTGNVCVWPSEEILTYHCLVNKQIFKNKRICELGGGMTCLAGIAVAATSEAQEVVLTDGNELSCENVDMIVDRNKHLFMETKVSTRELRWNEPASYLELGERVDVVLCADCLFFDQYRSDLIETIHSILHPDGKAIIFAPRRGQTLHQFCNLAHDRFCVELEDNYDPLVWSVYQRAKSKGKEEYDEDIHYPLKITLTKK